MNVMESCMVFGLLTIFWLALLVICAVFDIDCKWSGLIVAAICAAFVAVDK